MKPNKQVERPSSTASASLAPPQPVRASEALTRDVYRDLAIVSRMPCDLEYITPPEIVVIMRLCTIYHVNWSEGLVVSNDHPMQRRFLVPITNGDRETFEHRHIRVRKEPMLQDFNDSVVPDADFLWASLVLGRLKRAIHERLLAYSTQGV